MVAVLVERALGGDVGAARLLLERVIPPLRAAEEVAPVALPDGTLTEKGAALLVAVAHLVVRFGARGRGVGVYGVV